MPPPPSAIPLNGLGLRFDACHVKPVPWSDLRRDLVAVTARDVAASA